MSRTSKLQRREPRSQETRDLQPPAFTKADAHALWSTSLKNVADEFQYLHQQHPDVFAFLAEFPSTAATRTCPPDAPDPPPHVLAALLPHRLVGQDRVGLRSISLAERIRSIHLYGDTVGVRRFMELSRAILPLIAAKQIRWPHDLRPRCVLHDVFWSMQLFEWAIGGVPGLPIFVSRYAVMNRDRVAFEEDTHDHFYTTTLDLPRASRFGCDLVSLMATKCWGAAEVHQPVSREASDGSELTIRLDSATQTLYLDDKPIRFGGQTEFNAMKKLVHNQGYPVQLRADSREQANLASNLRKRFKRNGLDALATAIKTQRGVGVRFDWPPADSDANLKPT